MEMHRNGQMWTMFKCEHWQDLIDLDSPVGIWMSGGNTY